MSKEHKITKDGKKYVTKIIYSPTCFGCVFSTLSETFQHKCNFVNAMRGFKNKCLNHHYKDGKHRIWVEDTSSDSKTVNKANHVWVIEIYDEEDGWIFWSAEKNRHIARMYARSMQAKTRIRKYIPVK
jgi:hypothetical protein